METTKTCSKCKQVLPLDAFGKNRRFEDGLQRKCKHCSAIAAKAFYEANREKVLEEHRIYYEKNKAMWRENGRTYRERNKEKVLESHRTYNATNKELIYERNRAYAQKNPEKVATSKRAYTCKNREKIRAKGREYSRTCRVFLSKAYVALTLHIPASEATPELIEIKREELAFKRIKWKFIRVLKEKQNGK